MSSISLSVLLSQPGDGSIDHPIKFSSTKLSMRETNYTTTEREGIDMVYALQKI